MTNIWYKPENGKPEIVDSCSKHKVGYMLHEYKMAFGLLLGQRRHGKDKLWAGRKKDEPAKTE